MLKTAIVWAMCALALGCSSAHERGARGASMLEAEVDTGLSLESDDPYMTFRAIAWPAAEAPDRLLVAWGEVRYGDASVRLVHVAEVLPANGAHRSLASFDAEGYEAIHPQLALAGDVPVLSWDERDRVRVVIDPAGAPIHAAVETLERRSEHSLAATDTSILVAWAVAGTPSALPVLSTLDLDGTTRPSRVLAEWSDESYLDYGGRSVSVLTSPAGHGVVAWVRHPPHDTLLELLPIDGRGDGSGALVAVDMDGATARDLRIAPATGAPEVLVSASSWGEDGMETRVARVALDGSGEVVMGPSIERSLGVLTALEGTAPIAVAARVEDLSDDPEYRGCHVPPVIRSELWLGTIDGALGSEHEELVAVHEPAGDVDLGYGVSFLHAPAVVAVDGGFLVLWSEENTLRYRRSIR